MKREKSTLFYEPWSRTLALLPRVDGEGWRALHDERVERCMRPHWESVHAATLALPDGDELVRRSGGALEVDYGADAVRIGSSDLLCSEESAGLRLLAQSHMPWRKGPWDVCGMAIDAEWRSDLKWDRVVGALGDLTGKRVADVGCGNGYYMYRALELNPGVIVGLDPAEKFFHAFHFIQRMARDERLFYSMLGVENLDLFPESFDVVLCMGIIYHQRDPLRMLRWLSDATVFGGQIILESLGVPGEEDVALQPKGRYAKMRNVHYVPTASCMVRWMKEAGFRDVELISSTPTTFDEQRGTEWMTFESLSDFLDPSDVSKTIEGYPAPWRFIVRGLKG